MKKVLESMAIAALVVFAASCAKESNVEQEKGTKELHFVVKTAANAPVKSYLDNNLDGTYTPMWNKGDAMAIFTGEIAANTKVSATLYNMSDNGVTATFDGIVPAADNGYFKGITPAERVTNGLASEDGSECVGVNLGDPDAGYVQCPEKLTIDKNCDILVSKPTFYTSDGKDALIEENVYFKRVMSVVKVVVNGPESLKTEKIHSFTLTSSDATLSGRAKVDVTNAKVVGWTVPSKSLSAKYTDESNMPVVYDQHPLDNTVYYVANPTTLKSGTTLTVSGETDNYTINKEITLPKDIVFPESQIAVINLSLDESDFTEHTKITKFVVVKNADELNDGDEIVFVNQDKAIMAGSDLSSNYFKAIEGVIFNEDKTSVQLPEGCLIVTLEESASGWKLMNGAEKYLKATGVKTSLSWADSEPSVWAISISGTDYDATISTVYGTTTTELQWNVSANPKRLSNYTTNQGSVEIYKKEGPVVPKYEIVCAEVAEGCTISASATKAAEGKEITLTSTAASGYEFGGWSVTDESGNEINVVDNKFTMPASKVTVSASFSKINYTITKSDVEGGSFIVKVNGAEATTANYKDVVSLEATAAEGYGFSSWTVTNNETKATVSVSSNSFTMPAAGVTVKANFIKKVYSSLEELVADGTPTKDGRNVTVTLADEEITKLHVLYNGSTSGAYFNVGSKEIVVFCQNTPADWKVGGSVSGTLKNCQWKLYNGMWELCPDDYSELTCVSPCETPVITLNGAVATIECETEGATIHYTVDGTDPTSNSQVYTAAVTLTDGQTIKAIAVKDGMKDSAVAEIKYTSSSSSEELLMYVSTFSDKNLNTNEGIVTWKASIDALQLDSSSRGVQFGAAKGKFTITGTGHSSKVKKIVVVLSTNGTGNTLSATVGGTSIGTQVSLTKANNYEVVFESTTALSGDIVFSVNDTNKSVYFKSITVNPQN